MTNTSVSVSQIFFTPRLAASPNECARRGSFKPTLNDVDLKWYLKSGWAHDYFFDTDANECVDETMHFTPLVTPTGTTKKFRYVAQTIN